MAIRKITISEFLERLPTHLALDVRSPGEHLHAHIPGARSLPLFSDEERALVGTTYKQQSREKAIKAGLDFFGPKMRMMIEAVEGWMKQQTRTQAAVDRVVGQQETTKVDAQKEATLTGAPIPNIQHSTFKTENSVRQTPLLVHCWRGGMRSAGVAWLLDLYGFEVYTLVGGYKAYRQWVLAQFENTYSVNVLGGYTGSGKTPVLHHLRTMGESVIDLEALAHHKGSAFGGLGEPQQPSQEMFENRLAMALSAVAASGNPVWIEDESQRIGNKKIPDSFWHQMRSSRVYFMDIPFEERLQYITREYGKFEKEKLVNAVTRIQKRLGGLETKNAIQHLLEDNHAACFRILLNYYDKWYRNGLHNRKDPLHQIHTIPCKEVLTVTNARAVMTRAASNSGMHLG